MKILNKLNEKQTKTLKYGALAIGALIGILIIGGIVSTAMNGDLPGGAGSSPTTSINVMNDDWDFAPRSGGIKSRFLSGKLQMDDIGDWRKSWMERDITALESGTIKVKLWQGYKYQSLTQEQINGMSVYLLSDNIKVAELKVEDGTGNTYGKVSGQEKPLDQMTDMRTWTDYYTIDFDCKENIITFKYGSVAQTFQFDTTSVDGLRIETTKQQADWFGEYNLDFDTIVGVPASA